MICTALTTDTTMNRTISPTTVSSTASTGFPLLLRSSPVPRGDGSVLGHDHGGGALDVHDRDVGAGLELAPIVGAELARWGELQQDGAFWQFCLAGQLECASRDGHSGSDCAAGCDAWGAVGCALRHAAMVGGGRV